MAAMIGKLEYLINMLGPPTHPSHTYTACVMKEDTLGLSVSRNCMLCQRTGRGNGDYDDFGQPGTAWHHKHTRMLASGKNIKRACSRQQSEGRENHCQGKHPG